MKDRRTGRAGDRPPLPAHRGAASSDDAVEGWEPVPGDADGLVAGLGLMVGLAAGLPSGSSPATSRSWPPLEPSPVPPQEPSPGGLALRRRRLYPRAQVHPQRHRMDRVSGREPGNRYGRRLVA